MRQSQSEVNKLVNKSFLQKSPVQQEVPPSDKLQDHPYENLFELHGIPLTEKLKSIEPSKFASHKVRFVGLPGLLGS